MFSFPDIMKMRVCPDSNPRGIKNQMQDGFINETLSSQLQNVMVRHVKIYPIGGPAECS